MKLKLIFILMLILNAGLIKANSVDFYFEFGSSTLSLNQKNEVKSLVDSINHDNLAIFVLEGEFEEMPIDDIYTKVSALISQYT